MHTRNLLYTLILTFLLQASVLAAPRLTVIVVVDGLETSNLTLMRPYWPVGGLRTLCEEAYQTQIVYPHWVYGGAETTATLMTGTTPDVHGYTMDHYFSRTDKGTHLRLEDKQEKGIGTNERYSARQLLAPTITDELRMQYGREAKIYSIGIHAEQAILLGGHSADACCWMDEKTRKWVGTSYYSNGLPSSADKMNMSGRIQELSQRTWTPRMDIALYNRPTAEEKRKSFSYNTTQNLLKSPAINTLVIEQALALIEAEKLGKDVTPDLLLLELTTQTPQASGDAIGSAEQEDMYLCLNQDLGYMMEQINAKIGASNYRVLLVGRPLLGISADAMKTAGMEIQHFNVDRAVALTSTYLMAIYGHERWVDGGYGNSIYLNRTLIEQKRLPLETIQRQVATLIMEFEGVQLALPTADAIMHPTMQRSINKHSIGDVVFTLEPGWSLTCENKEIDHVINMECSSPLLLWSGAIQSWPNGEIDATDVKDLILK